MVNILITGKTNSEDIFKKLNLALQRFEGKELSCPNNEKILIPIYDCKGESIRVVTREEFLGLIRSYNCGDSDFVILGEVFKGETKTISEVGKEFFVQFESSDFNFFLERLNFSKTFELPSQYNGAYYVNHIFFSNQDTYNDFLRHFNFIERDLTNVLINGTLWKYFLRNEFYKRILNEYYLSKKDLKIENYESNYLLRILEVSSIHFGSYSVELVNQKLLLFYLELLYLLGTRPNNPHFTGTDLEKEWERSSFKGSFGNICKRVLYSLEWDTTSIEYSDWKTLVQSNLEPDNTSFLYQSQKEDFIIFTDELYQFLFEEKNNE